MKSRNDSACAAVLRAFFSAAPTRTLAAMPSSPVYSATVALILTLSSHAAADSWASPEVLVAASRNGEIIFRVTPGTRHGLVGSLKRDPTAEGRWFRFRDSRYELYQTAQLVNPVAPLSIEVANNGAVVTLDNWAGAGHGDVVVIYAPTGKVLKKYGLGDLYPSSTIAKMPQSISSIWWRCRSAINPRGELELHDSVGGRFTFSLETGKFNYQPGTGACKP